MKDALGHGSNAHSEGIAKLPTAYEAAKQHRDALEAESKKAGAILKAMSGGGPFNMTPDHVKASPEYKSAKAAHEKAFAALREFNGGFVKQYAKEIKADRAKRYGG